MDDLHELIGVEITQGDAVRASAGALSLLPLEGTSARLVPESASSNWEEFIRDLVPRAESLLAYRLDEETYVAQIVAQLKRVVPLTIPSWNELPRHQL